jgi:hypothetical protein
MEQKDDLEGQFDTIFAEATREKVVTEAGFHTKRIVSAIALLGKSTVRLDRTSSRLAKVNIALTVVVVLIGILQLVLMFWGK